MKLLQNIAREDCITALKTSLPGLQKYEGKTGFRNKASFYSLSYHLLWVTL